VKRKSSFRHLHRVLGPPPIIMADASGGNTSVAPQSGSVNRVTKIGGGGGWNASAVSTTGFVGDCLVRTRSPLATNTNAMVALDDNPHADDSFGMDRVIWFGGAGEIIFYEAGAEVGIRSSYIETDRFFLRRRVSAANAVTAWKGATDNLADAVLVHTYTPLAGTLFVDTSFNGPDVGTLDIYGTAL
jgi:hypothetical protein